MHIKCVNCSHLEYIPELLSKIERGLLKQAPSTLNKLLGRPLVIRYGARRVGKAYTAKAKKALKTRKRALNDSGFTKRSIYKTHSIARGGRDSLSADRRAQIIENMEKRAKAKKKRRLNNAP